MTKTKQIKLIKELAKLYKVRVYFYKYSSIGSGFYKINIFKKTGSIHIQTKGTRDLLSIFFHELGHHHCLTNGIWPTYHDYNVRIRKGNAVFTEEFLKSKIKTAFKAECWVDLWAEKEMMKYVDLPYDPGYVDKPNSKLWFHRNYLDQFKIMLKWV